MTDDDERLTAKLTNELADMGEQWGDFIRGIAADIGWDDTKAMVEEALFPRPIALDDGRVIDSSSVSFTPREIQ